MTVPPQFGDCFLLFFEQVKDTFEEDKKNRGSD